LGTETLLTVSPGSETADALATQPPAFPSLIKKLPGDALIYYSLHGNFEKFIAQSMGLASGVYGEDDREQLEASIEKLKDVKWGGSAGAIWLGDLQDGVLRTLSLTALSPVDKYKEVTREITKNIDLEPTAGVKQEISLEEDVVKIDGYDVDLITVTQEFDDEADPFGMADQVMTALFGPGGLKQRLVYLDDAVLTTMGPPSVAERGVQLATGKTKQDPSLGFSAAEQVRLKLSENVNLLGLIDFARLFAKAAKIVADAGVAPIAIDSYGIEQLGIEPSFSGMSLVTEDAALRVKTVLPVAQVKGIADLATYLQEAAAQQ
jgi:hypothetical protein